jgi:MSHA biogenesis protein MshO
VELVMVILLLGVMATFSSQFIGIGTQIYGDASRREQLMSDARFALERLNREVRDAVPGSVRVEDEGRCPGAGACLRFWPIATAGRYLETASSTVLRIVEPVTMPAKEDTAIIYPLPDTTSGSTITLDKGVCRGVALPE